MIINIIKFCNYNIKLRLYIYLVRYKNETTFQIKFVRLNKNQNCFDYVLNARI